MVRAITCALALCLASGVWAVWTVPTNVGSGVNTSSAEVDPQVTADGSVMYFGSNRGGGFGGYDIWASGYAGSWQPASNLGGVVNSSSDDRGPAPYFTTYLYLYFTSTRAGGLGGTDIWRTYYSSGTWNSPLNQTILNSSYEDVQPFILPTSPAVCFFASNRPGGFGGYDIWASTWGTSNWTAPVNLGSAVNTSADETGATTDLGGNVLYFYSNRAGGSGGYDLYKALPSGGSWGTVQNLGSPPNTASYEGQPGSDSAGATVYLVSDRSGGMGGYDIWATTNDVAIEPASLGRVKATFK